MSDHETKVQKLAYDMALHIDDAEDARPYARAIVKAEEALESAIEWMSADDCDCEDTNYSPCSYCLSSAALSDLRALMGEEG